MGISAAAERSYPGAASIPGRKRRNLPSANQPTQPQGLLGLNSVVVFGENLQVAVPLNHQLAVGSNLQICINPLGLAAGVPTFPAGAVSSGILGGGIGGNMQFTIGTSANVV